MHLCCVNDSRSSEDKTCEDERVDHYQTNISRHHSVKANLYDLSPCILGYNSLSLGQYPQINIVVLILTCLPRSVHSTIHSLVKEKCA